MRRRTRLLTVLATASALGLIVLGAIASTALAAPKGKPGVTPPGVPPGQPFQALQREIDALDTRVDALEATAPRAGLMWINSLDLRALTSILALGAAPGLSVTGVAVGDVVQVGLQVPLGYAITGVKVCYLSGAAGSFISNVQLLQYGVPPTTPPTSLLNDAFLTPGIGTVSCVDTTTAVLVDPSAGGPVYLSLAIVFNALEAIVIRGIGLQLEPVVAGP